MIKNDQIDISQNSKPKNMNNHVSKEIDQVEYLAFKSTKRSKYLSFIENFLILLAFCFLIALLSLPVGKPMWPYIVIIIVLFSVLGAFANSREGQSFFLWKLFPPSEQELIIYKENLKWQKQEEIEKKKEEISRLRKELENL